MNGPWPSWAEEAFKRVDGFITSGGPVMWGLIAVGLMLWTLIILRAFALRRGLYGPLARALGDILAGRPRARWRGLLGEAALLASRLLAGNQSSTIEELELDLRSRRFHLHRYARVIQTLIMAAPLLGLLGTVSGMIETFDSLADMTLFSAQSGGIAGGISQALTTTQLGLGIAIPGLLVDRLLEQKARRLGRDLDHLELSVKRAYEKGASLA